MLRSTKYHHDLINRIKNKALGGSIKPNSNMQNNLTFGQALEAVKEGKLISREGWNGKNMFLQLQKVDENSKMQHDYIYMSDVNGKLFPWNPNNLDMLANDWCILD